MVPLPTTNTCQNTKYNRTMIVPSIEIHPLCCFCPVFLFRSIINKVSSSSRLTESSSEKIPPSIQSSSVDGFSTLTSASDGTSYPFQIDVSLECGRWYSLSPLLCIFWDNIVLRDVREKMIRAQWSVSKETKNSTCCAPRIFYCIFRISKRGVKGCTAKISKYYLNTYESLYNKSCGQVSMTMCTAEKEMVQVHPTSKMHHIWASWL